MKKILAVLISAMMLVNIGFTAFADGGEVPSDTASSKSVNHSQVSRHKKSTIFIGDQAILSVPNIKPPLHLA